MVGHDIEGVLSALEVVPPLVQCSDYHQEFLIVDLVVALSFVEGLQVECDRMQLPIGLYLSETSVGVAARCLVDEFDGRVDDNDHLGLS